MQPRLIKLFHSLGRKSAAKRTGIAEIPTTISAEGHGAGFYTTLRNAGFKDEDLAKLIKSEKDIIRLVNKVKSMQNQRLKNIERKFFDPSGKMKPEGQDIMKKGLEGLGKKKDPFQVIEGGGTSAEDFLKLKEDTFRRLTMNTDDNVKAFSKRIIENKQDVKFERLTKDQRKGILDLIDDRLKLGNREFMNKHSDLNVVIDPEDFASGGIAGELHLHNGGRARFQDGALAAYQKGAGMWNPDKSLVSVGINPATGTPEWMYPHEAAAMGIFPTMDYEGNKIAPASTISSQDQDLLKYTGSGLLNQAAIAKAENA